jgi:hypothetical protein
MNAPRPIILIAASITLSALAGVGYAFFAGGGHAGADPTNENVPLSDKPQSEVDATLRSAEKNVGFAIKAPTFFPTGSSRLALVDSRVGPKGSDYRRAELIYDGGKTMSLRGKQVVSSLEIFLMPVRVQAPEGKPWGRQLSSYDMYREVVDLGDDGQPIRVTYTALGAKETIIMTFTGEQPDEAGLGRMMASFKPAVR